MLAGTFPLLSGASKWLDPAQANGNDSYVVSLLHFDAPDAQIGVTGQGFTDSAYGAPARKNAWAVSTGAPATTASFPFNQVGNFSPGGRAIQCPHGDDLIPQGDFTIDFWAAFNGTATTGLVIGKTVAGGFGPYSFVQNAANFFFYASSNGTAWDLVNGAALASGFIASIWYHFAVTRQGATIRTFINGGLVQTISGAGKDAPLYASTDPLSIGGVTGGPTGAFWIDEFRLSNGLARWTAAFTPPNQPYYARLNGGNDDATKLLLHFDKDTFTTDSANGAMAQHTVTNNGATQVGAANNPALMQNVAAVGGGTQRISIPASNDFNIMRANFTVDLWYFRTANVGANCTVIARRNTSAQIGSFNIVDNGSGTLTLLMSNAGATWDINETCATGLALNTWYHLALVRNGADLSFYVNGARTYQRAISSGSFWNTSNALNIGGLSDGSGNKAQIDEVRYSDVARWTGPFTPPGAPYA